MAALVRVMVAGVHFPVAAEVAVAAVGRAVAVLLEAVAPRGAGDETIAEKYFCRLVSNVELVPGDDAGAYS